MMSKQFSASTSIGASSRGKCAAVAIKAKETFAVDILLAFNKLPYSDVGLLLEYLYGRSN